MTALKIPIAPIISGSLLQEIMARLEVLTILLNLPALNCGQLRIQSGSLPQHAWQ
jgi:hypothetical protein